MRTSAAARRASTRRRRFCVAASAPSSVSRSRRSFSAIPWPSVCRARRRLPKRCREMMDGGRTRSVDDAHGRSVRDARDVRRSAVSALASVRGARCARWTAAGTRPACCWRISTRSQRRRRLAVRQRQPGRGDSRRLSDALAVRRLHDIQERLRRATPLAGLPKRQPHLPRRAQLRHFDGDQVSARDLGQRAAARQQRHADPHLDRALDAVEARQRNLDVDRRAPALVGAQDALAGRRRFVVRDHDLPADLLDRDPSSVRERMARRREQDDVVAAERDGLDAAIGGLEREHAEVERCGRGPPRRSGATARGGLRRPPSDAAPRSARCAAAGCAPPPRWRP